MTNITSMLRKCLLAVTLAATALGAWAAPTSFHVNLNTATLGAEAKYIDFLFSRAGTAPQVTATVSNLTGAFGSVFEQDGLVTLNANGSFSIGNGAAPGELNYIDFNAIFGGNFGFDVSFDTAFLGDASLDGSQFSVSVLDADFAPVGADVLALFDLNSAGISTTSFGGLATITAIDATSVPEPSSMLMMMTGLGLVGFTARRRKSRAEEAATA